MQPRFGSGINFPPGLEPEKKQAVDTIYDVWPENAHEATDVDAWPALPERNSIRRVCLLTFPLDW